jgi:hypothetical protein
MVSLMKKKPTVVTNLEEYKNEREQERYPGYENIDVAAAMKDRLGIEPGNRFEAGYNQKEAEKLDEYIRYSARNADRNQALLNKDPNFHF